MTPHPVRPSRPTRRRGRRLAAAVAALAAASGLAACRPAPETLTVSTVLGGLDRPWDLAFAPNGDMFVTEKVGRIRLRLTNGTVRTVAAPGDVVVAGEGGMMGLAVDPGF
ncbi:MAG TPA: PQQ-dependent sugar dehydrogenase, partial [Aquihabitans sp.]|nr:PQQ-dependent sugar dehydrogenase [Aquihabitans sp.]